MSPSSIRQYWERRPFLLTAVLFITLGAPFLGLLLAGGRGVVAGLILSLLSLMLGFFAVTRVRDVNTTEFPPDASDGR